MSLWSTGSELPNPPELADDADNGRHAEHPGHSEDPSTPAMEIFLQVHISDLAFTSPKSDLFACQHTCHLRSLLRYMRHHGFSKSKLTLIQVDCDASPIPA